MTTYHVSYNFTATINGQESQVYVDGTRVDSVVYDRFTPPCAATVRFLEREPRRCALKHAAEMETNHWCHNLVLACFTCIPSIFILAGAGVGLGIPLNMGVDGAAKAAGAGTYAIIIGVTLVFVYRALSIKEAHAVICCLSSQPCFTEFNNVKVMTPQDHEVQRDAEERAQAALRNQRMERERAIELEPRTSQFRGPFKDYCKPLAPYCVSADGMRIYGRVPTTHKQHTRAYVLPLCLHTCLCPQLGGNPCPFEGDVLQETHLRQHVPDVRQEGDNLCQTVTTLQPIVGVQ